MEIFLMRHGIAAELSIDGRDADRQLTAKGIAKTEQVAANLQAKGWQFDLILSSPLMRAYQTAEILLKAGLSDVLEIQPQLAPTGLLADWLSWLQTHRQDNEPMQRIILVGHEPNLSQWAENLVFGQTLDRLHLKKAGVMALQAPATDLIGQCKMLWLIPPKCWI
jgi:phosphohistidine phosphatase